MKYVLTNLIVANIFLYICIKSLECIPQTYAVLHVNYISVKLEKIEMPSKYFNGKCTFKLEVHENLKKKDKQKK